MLKLFRCCTTITINNTKKTLSGGSASVICPDLHSQSQWQSTIQTSESWHWNMSCLCVLSISHILPGSLSLTHHLSPKGRILEESLIIFTAHSIIPAKRLIHDLPQWRPTPQSQREKEAKQGTKSASVQKNVYCQWQLLLFWIFVGDEIQMIMSKRKETWRNKIWWRIYLYPSCTKILPYCLYWLKCCVLRYYCQWLLMIQIQLNLWIFHKKTTNLQLTGRERQKAILKINERIKTLARARIWFVHPWLL